MKIVLLKDVPGIGQKGDIRDAADGYALNFLIPKKLAEHATVLKIAEHEAWSHAVEESRKKKEGEYGILVARLHNTHITIKTSANATGKLYKRVTADLVSEHVQRQLGISIPPDTIQFPESIRQVGESTVNVHLGAKRASLTVHVEKLDKIK